ncbi:MAG: thrombospondin type 3 repeat-containing protein [Patescibacteria group bacterium]
MKKLFWLAGLLAFFLLPCFAYAFTEDLVLSAGNVSFSTSSFLEGKTIRIYANVTNPSGKDLRGVVKFSNENGQIKEDQPVSVLAGKDDSVFIDWTASPGEHNIRIILIPFEKEQDNPANNTVEKQITVFADTDRDGIANKDDPDDDNDGVKDEEDAFPLDKKEQLDSDGDQIGNNKDEDDDNDGVKDTEDALPLNANETVDTDKDGIGDNEDTDDDGDGVSDSDEIKIGSNPLKPDTDGDNINDKEDGWPLDPKRGRDFDKDGIPDAEDTDADNDGVPKKLDVNDTNLPPVIVITTGQFSSQKIMAPNEIVEFETTKTVDPEGGKITTLWKIDDAETADQIETGEKLEISFKKPGFHKIAVTVTDDKLEQSLKTFTVLVAPPYVPWIFIMILFVIFILAIFFIFSYSKRRVPKWKAFTDTLDTILKFLPKPKK